jgi:hypothetical protein
VQIGPPLPGKQAGPIRGPAFFLPNDALRSVEMDRDLWHRSPTMPSNSTFADLASKGVYALLLVSVVLSGIPVVEAHSHENATYGHSHDVHDFFDDHGAGEADNKDGDTDTGSSHAHDISAPSLAAVANVSMDSTVKRHSHSHIPPPYCWLPDNIVVPLYRPPIA